MTAGFVTRAKKQMKVLIVHNRYQERGGEDAVVESERALLSAHGVDVQYIQLDNDRISNLTGKLAASISVFYNRKSIDLLNAAIRNFRPDVVHVHNWFATLSPGIFWACRKQGIPVVHTLHNYRLFCATGNLSRDGRVCEECMNSALRIPGIVHGCYRESRLGTAVASSAMLMHWGLGTWRNAVDIFIALTEFGRKKFIDGGLPEHKIVVKPNFLDFDPGFRNGQRDYFLFVGRLSDIKGISTLLKCWSDANDLPPLKIVGDGPLADDVRAATALAENIEWLGSKSADEVLDLMGGAKALICSSVCYEGMPRVIIESLAVGTPVIGPRLGSYPEMIAEGKFGALFTPGDSVALAASVRQFEQVNAQSAMRVAARKEFQARYTGPENFKLLDSIYRRAIDDVKEPSKEVRQAYEPV